MTDNVFQPTLNEPSAYTHIQQPVQNETTAKAVDLASRIGVAAAKKIAIHGLTGGTASPEEAAGEAINAAEGGVSANPTADANQQMAMESIDNMSKLSRARKAGLGLDQARDRARAILARSVNDNPLFADDIRKAYQSYFGGGGGAGNIFDATPEEKADMQFREDVQMLSNELQITSQASADMIRGQRADAIKLKDIEVRAAEANISGDDYNHYTQLSTLQASSVFNTEVFAQMNKTGPLNEQQKMGFNNKITMLANQMRKNNLDRLKDANGKLQLGTVDREGLAAAESQIVKWEESQKMLIKNNGLAEVLQANKGILENKYRAALLNTYAPLMAAQEVWGREGSELILQQFLNNDSYALIAKKNPFIASAMGSLGDFNTAFPTAMVASFSKFMGTEGPDLGITQSAVEVAGGAAVMSSDKGPKNLEMIMGQKNTAAALQHLREIYQGVPETLVAYQRPGYQALVHADPGKYGPAMQSSADGALRALTTLSVLESTNGKPDLQISFRKTTGHTPGIELTLKGDGASALVKTRFSEVAKFAETYPSVWQDDFGSANEYLADYFGFEGVVPTAADLTTEQVEEFRNPGAASRKPLPDDLSELAPQL